MEKTYNEYSFKDYPPTEILGEDFYLKSRKNLSFQYRDKKSDELLGFISLGKEEMPVHISEIVRSGNGCRILMVNVKKIVSPNKCQPKDIDLLDVMLEEAEFYINAWCDKKNDNEFEFDYIWFDVRDFDEKDALDITERIGEAKRIDNFVYKIVERISKMMPYDGKPALDH